MPDLLKAEDLVTHFFTSQGVVRAVDGVDLTIGEKRIVGLVGESGSGKSMTAFSVLRLVPPPGKILQGKIFFKGRNLLELSDEEMRKIRGREITMVFQDPMTFLNPVLKIGFQMAEPLVYQGIADEGEAQSRVLEILRRVGIPSPERVVESYPHQLSGGMKQRCLIGMALSTNPSLLIADEPTTALDVTIQAQILYLLKSLVTESGTSLLLITHDLGIIAEVCDDVYVMYGGKIVEAGEVFDIFDEPAHPYTKALLECVLSLAEYKAKVVGIPGTVPSLITPPPGCRFHPRCPHVMPVCREQIPPFMEVKKGHKAACWLYEK